MKCRLDVAFYVKNQFILKKLRMRDTEFFLPFRKKEITANGDLSGCNLSERCNARYPYRRYGDARHRERP